MIRTNTLFKHNVIKWTKAMLLSGVLGGSILVSPLQAQSANQTANPAAVATPSRYRPARFPKRAGEFYGLIWGVDSLSVKAAESGELIRFSFRVLDADKAQPLNDKKNEPFLIASDQHVKLVIPSLEKVGQLRQSGTPKAGGSYWMAFSNPRRTVKRGDRVDVVIGKFRAEGLVVE
jgi:hypothetical protein